MHPRQENQINRRKATNHLAKLRHLLQSLHQNNSSSSSSSLSKKCTNKSTRDLQSRLNNQHCELKYSGYLMLLRRDLL